MAITPKKIYCSNCKKLAGNRRHRDGHTTTVLCNRCGKPLYSWDGVGWKYIGGERNE